DPPRVLATPADQQGDLLDKVQASLLQEVARGFKLKVEDIDPDKELSEYGFDSISFKTLTHQLSQFYGVELLPTSFFEHPTPGKFARYLVAHHSAALANRFAPTAKPADKTGGDVDAGNLAGAARPRRQRQASGFMAPGLTGQRARATLADAVAVIGMSGRF